MSENESENKFLVFSVGEELYASPLLSIREVLEFQPPKPMPNMVHYFTGVINVRGAIVGVIDLRTKFGHEAKNWPRTPFLLCDTSRGAIATIVDSVERVQAFAEDQIDRHPPVATKVEQSYLMGVAKSNQELITLVDIEKLLNEQEYKKASGV
jgi:purine-binding chemotaxis protein CheW